MNEKELIDYISTASDAEIDKIMAQLQMDEDFSSYAERVLKVQTEDSRITAFALNKPQRILHRIIEEHIAPKRPIRIVGLKARRMGFSTYFSGRYYRAVSNAHNKYAIQITHEPDATTFLFNMVKRFHNLAPDGFRPETIANNAKLIDFNNAKGTGLNSAFRVATAGKDDVGSGQLIHFAHLTEVAKWPAHNTKDVLTSLLQCVPDLPGTEVAFESTAKGLGGEFYARFWGSRYYIFVTRLDANGDAVIEETINEGAPEDNVYTSTFLPWFCHDRYCHDMGLVIDEIGFGKSLTQEERELMARHGLTMGHISWRRWCIANRCNGSVETFNQEYPTCIVGDSRVGTEWGMIPIRDLSYANGIGMEHGSLSGWYPRGVKQVFRVTTSLGYEVIGTGDHKVSTDGEGFVEIKDLVGETIILQPPMFSNHYETIELDSLPCISSVVSIDKEFGRFTGYFMGDGSFHDNTLSIVCTKTDTDVVADVVHLFRQFFGEPEVRTVGSKRGCVEVRINRVAIRPLLLELGMIRSSNGVRRVVCVPEFIFRSPKPVVREFLRGLFEADGFAGKQHPRVSLFSKHMNFLRDVQLLLLGFGITCRRVSRPAKSGYGFSYTSNTLDLRLNEAVLYGEEIGFVSSRKQGRMRDTAREKKQKNRSNVFDLELRDKVISVVANGEQEVFDISVRGNPWFSANGILVHNCPRDAFLGSGRAVFDNAKVQARIDVATPPIARYELISGNWVASPTGRLRVWREPVGGSFYICSADVSEGKADGDFCSADVIDHLTGEQVAQWHGKIDCDNILEYVPILAALGRRYNTALLAPERNNHGLIVVQQLHLQGYPNLYMELVPNPPSKPTKRYGWVTSRSTRPVIIDNLIKELVDGSDGIRCKETLEEMQSFRTQDNGKQEADAGRCDDRVISLAIGKYIRSVSPPPRSMVPGGANRMSGAPPKRSPLGWT